MSRPAIEIRNISKVYQLGAIGATSLKEELGRAWNQLRGRSVPRKTGEFAALRDVSFDVQPGQVIGIIGRNGAGKSTLLKILSRITQQTSGEIRIRGRVGSLLEVGTGFHPDLTGRENVFLNGAILGMTKAEIRGKFDEIVAFAEIEKFIDTPVKRYSSGMYVRLAFAVAAHLEPEILILDEVLAVGDQQFQNKCLGKMQEISSGDGRTILFVSHSMAAIRRLCEKCVVLKNGVGTQPLDIEPAIEMYTENLKESVYDLDVTDAPRSWGAEARICRMRRIRVTSPHLLAYGKPMEIEITLDVHRPIAKGMIGMGFNNVEGTRILTLDSDINDHCFELQPGTYVIRARMESLPLHPAFYNFCVTIGGGGAFYDMLDPATWEVKTSSEDRWSDRGAAGCRVEPQLCITSVKGQADVYDSTRFN